MRPTRARCCSSLRPIPARAGSTCRYLDGTVDEWAYATWYEMDLEEVEPPEEWRASMDEVRRDRGR